MKINLQQTTIRKLVEGYEDNQELGVVALEGWLNVRPAYQREFVYKDKQRDAVIDTVMKGLPLNVMYWVADNKDKMKYEVLDGQQRTLSICQFVDGVFSVNHRFFHNFTQEEKDKFLDYELMIYICEGTDKEKMDWFQTINIAGEKLTMQELRNATYTGRWLIDAKMKFSKTKCPAYLIGEKYMSGTPIRQDYLETVLDWMSNGKIEEYMANNQHEPNAEPLWDYYGNVIQWVTKVFPTYRKEMKGLPWGKFYNIHRDKGFADFEPRINELMMDEEVSKKKGIYEYLLTGEEKHLSLRAFTDKQKTEAYHKQGGKCAITGEAMDIKEMEADHIVPWSKGGKTNMDNLQMISRKANREKGAK